MNQKLVSRCCAGQEAQPLERSSENGLVPGQKIPASNPCPGEGLATVWGGFESWQRHKPIRVSQFKSQRRWGCPPCCSHSPNLSKGSCYLMLRSSMMFNAIKSEEVLLALKQNINYWHILNVLAIFHIYGDLYNYETNIANATTTSFRWFCNVRTEVVSITFLAANCHGPTDCNNVVMITVIVTVL